MIAAVLDSSWTYLILLAALVVFGPRLVERAMRRSEPCPACIRRSALDRLVAESEAEIGAAFDSVPRDLSSVAPVVPIQRDRRSGR